MTTVTLACQAMATRFEIVLHGENAVSLRAAGEEALQEVERLDARLSLYRPESEISQINAQAARKPVQASPDLFALLQLAKRLTGETGGAFDITIGPLLRCWGFMGGNGSLPDRVEIARARAVTGMNLVQLNARDRTVRFEREGVLLDLGAIGKGFAVETMANILRAAGVTSALIHGGTSTLYALGHPPGARHWKVAIERPPERSQPDSLPATAVAIDLRRSVSSLTDNSGTGALAQNPTERRPLLAIIPLKDEAMSVSAVWGKSFQAEGRTFGHILDPRAGVPVEGAKLAAVILPSATETDAFSTALLVLGRDGHDLGRRVRSRMKSLILTGSGPGWEADARGMELLQPIGTAGGGQQEPR